jgi:AcrR family transcriptional regulator
MTTRVKSTAKPMKQPVQARSMHTVECIYEATIQVLVESGINQLTTTKVADKAGASVGTLYQYFPNKATLLNAVLERHLTKVVCAVELACNAAKNKPLKTMTAAVVHAFVEVKLADPKASRALYAVASELNSAGIVMKMTQRSQLALCDMLATATDAQFPDLRSVSYILTTALIGPVQGLLQSDSRQLSTDLIKQQLVVMAVAYLRESAVRRKAS